MKAIRSFLSHPRTRAPRRLPAPVVWGTALAVLFSQAVAPSYAGIAVTTLGSSAVVHLSVLEWADGVPTRVEAFLPDRADPVVTTIDPDVVRRAVWTETAAEGAWRRGRVTIPGTPGHGTYDLAFRTTETGGEAFASPAGDPGGALHLELDGRESVPMTDNVAYYLAALLACALIADLMQQRCFGSAKETCGAGNVKCANYTGGCGVGSCTIQCKGSPDSCD